MLRKKKWKKFRFRQKKLRHQNRYRNLILVSVADTEASIGCTLILDYCMPELDVTLSCSAPSQNPTCDTFYSPGGRCFYFSNCSWSKVPTYYSWQLQTGFLFNTINLSHFVFTFVEIPFLFFQMNVNGIFTKVTKK